MKCHKIITYVAIFLMMTFAVAGEGRAQPSLMKQGKSSILSIRFMADGKKFASASFDGTVVLWHAETGDRIWTLDLDGGAKGKDDYTISNIYHMEASRSRETLAISYAQSRVVAGTLQKDIVRKIGLVDVKNGQVIRTLTGSGPLAFSPTEEQLLWIGGDESVRLCDTKSGSEVLTIKLRTGAQSLALSPDGKQIVIATGPVWGLPSEEPKPIVGLYDAKTGALLREFPRQYSQVTGIAYTTNGEKLLIGGFNMPQVTTTVWNLSSPSSTKPETILASETDHTKNFAFSQDGALLVYSHQESGRPVVSIRGLTNQKVRNYKIESEPGSLALSPDSSILAAGTENGEIHLIRLGTHP